MASSSPFYKSAAVLAFLIAGLAGCDRRAEPSGDGTQQAPQVAQEVQTNPFLQPWDTPFAMPPFANIKPEHYMPAFEAAIAKHKEEVQAIKDNPAAADFANTVLALDESGRDLDRVSRVFFNLASSQTSEELQKIQREIAPVLTKHRSEILLDNALFARVRSVYEARDASGLDREQQRLVFLQHRDFKRSGAILDKEAKDRLAAIEEEITSLSVNYGQHVLKENQAYSLVLESEEELAGLPSFVRDAAAQAARDEGKEGKYVFKLNRSSMGPFLTFSERRDLRENIFSAWTSRGDQNNDNDNKEIAAKIAALRVERANLLGFSTHAAWVLDTRMAKTPAAVYAFMDQVWEAALPRAKQELADMQQIIDEEDGGFALQPWDWFHYAEKVRKARFDLDEKDVKPYFSLENVRDGAFMVANRLFGITFHRRTDVPLYHPDLQAFEVKDSTGAFVGLFVFDFFSREGKRGGAWMSSFKEQAHKQQTRPIILNNCNFSKGAQGGPTLLSFNDARTLFHEFGHGLHGLLSNRSYYGLSGVSGPRDYTEFPAQLMEHWIAEESVLEETALHYATKEPMPKLLLEKIRKARTFNQGYATVEYLAAAYLDMDWHMLETTDLQDADAFEKASMERIGMMPEIVVRYRSTYFNHIFAGGYSAGYYAYLWSEILDSDGFQAFVEAGDIYDPGLAKKLYDNIYSAGGLDEAMRLYVGFRGKEPTIEPLLENRGLKKQISN